MPRSEPQIPARYYARTAEVLQRSGVDVAALLKAARIRPEALAAPEGLLALHQVEAFVTQAYRMTGRTDVGLEVGRALKLSSHSILGYALLSSPNLDYALRLASRYFRLMTPTFRMRYRCDRRHAVLTFEPALALSPRCFAFHLETAAVATHGALSELLRSALPPYDMYLSVAEPPHARRYRALGEVRCHFGDDTPGLRMVLPADVMRQRLVMADPASLKMAESRCDELFRHAAAAGKVSDWVRMMLREARDGWPSLAELAHTLNLSARTLDRHLVREGTGFRELARRARHERARALLAEGRLSVTQVAHELGYSDAANFTRAFRREGGRSPSRHRADL